MNPELMLWRPVLNQSSETIPAYAIMQITGVNGDQVVTVNKCTTDSTKLFLINSGATIQPGDGGVGYAPMEMPYWVYYDTADGTPANGEQWGPASGSWKAKKGKTGLLMLAMTSEAVRPMTGLAPAILEVCRS